MHLISWQIFLKLWCELASGLPRVRWKSMTETPEYGNSILIPATLMLLFYLLFVTCLGYAWHIERQKERYFSCALMHLALKHTAVPFVKAGRQPSLFVWGISPSEARNNVQDSSNLRNATCNFYELLKELNKLFPWDHFSWKAVFLSNFFFFFSPQKERFRFFTQGPLMRAPPKSPSHLWKLVSHFWPTET